MAVIGFLHLEIDFLRSLSVMLTGSNLLLSAFPFLNIFDVQLLSGSWWYELQVDTAGDEFLDPLMCDF